MDIKNALSGALVADAAALGLHWMYDQEQIAAIESTGSVLFRQPDINAYADRKAFFAHAGRHAGQLSHYGESARLLSQVCSGGSYDKGVHRQAFFASFGPCGTFKGYADRPTKALIGRMLIDGEDLREPSGMDDDQMPGLCPVAGVFAHGLSREDTASAVSVISTHNDVLESAELLHRCLDYVAEGLPLAQALSKTANAGSSALNTLLQEALALDGYQPLKAAMQFGMPCHVSQGMPVVWHILNHVDSFESAVHDNISCGGDSCGRAMLLGPLAGLAFGVPADMLSRIQASIEY
ncbi:MAG: ADP-ribosylglycohydrolase family protein [Granulosicoccus sp.]